MDVKDHPRLRGEHDDRQGMPEKWVGSPPPTRGTPITGVRRAEGGGITPAYAGNTNLLILYKIAQKDHPRLRGEHKITDN